MYFKLTEYQTVDKLIKPVFTVRTAIIKQLVDSVRPGIYWIAATDKGIKDIYESINFEATIEHKDRVLNFPTIYFAGNSIEIRGHRMTRDGEISILWDLQPSSKDQVYYYSKDDNGMDIYWPNIRVIGKQTIVQLGMFMRK